VWHGHGGRIKTNPGTETDQMRIAGCFQRIEARVHVLHGVGLGLSMAYRAVVTRTEAWSHVGIYPQTKLRADIS
jgi:hypothetical protein